MREKEKARIFLLCTMVTLAILFLRVVAEYPPALILSVQRLRHLAESFLKAFGLFEFVQWAAKIPFLGFVLLLAVLQLLLGLLFLRIFQQGAEQGAYIIAKKGESVTRMGILLYFMDFILILVFLYSVIGAFFGFFLFAVTIAVSFFGSISLSLFIGFQVAERLHIQGHTTLYFLLGRFLMVLCESIFGVGSAFLFFVFPAVSLGAAVMLFLYRKVWKCELPSLFQKEFQKESFDREKIRDIIKGNTGGPVRK